MKKTADLSLPLLLCAVALGGLFSPASAPAQSAAPPAATDPAAKAAPAPAATTPHEVHPTAATPRAVPEDDKTEWLVDESGKEYSVVSYPKRNVHEVKDGWLLIKGGFKFEIVGEDEKAYQIKVPRVQPHTEGPTSRAVRIEPTKEELAAADATYPAPPADSDRLQFGKFDKGMPTRGHWRNGFDLVDMNADGKLDFVQGPPRKGGDQPRIYLGDGAGAWRPAAANAPPGILDYGDVRVADLDGDGKLDLAMAVHLRGVLVLKGDGRGNFTPLPEGSGLEFRVPKVGQPSPSFSARRIELLDWNRDGKLDILAYSEGPTSTIGASHGPSSAAAEEVKANEEYSTRGPRIYLNQGKGKFKVAASPDTAKDLFGDDFEVADLDQDGRPDFVLASNLMGRNNLVFLNAPKSGGWTNVTLEGRPRGYVRAVASGDWNGDGKIDVALSYVNFELGVKRNGVDLYYREADGSWRRAPLTSKAGLNPLVALASGDVDGDGHADIVGLDRDGGLALYLGDGSGKFSSEKSPEAQEPFGRCRGYGLRVADLDGDGAGEIVATYADEPVALYDPERCIGNGGVAVFKGGPADAAATPAAH